LYSQNDEEKHITHHFRGAKGGTFLDIGAFHPKTFSNTRALYEMGFKGVFVEPSPSLMQAFVAEYGDDPAIELVPLCIGTTSGMVEFFDSGGDAISTTVAAETKRWEEAYNVRFQKSDCEMVTVAELVGRSRYNRFDFINVDTEGNVLEILEQIDPVALGVELMCVEWNGKDKDRFVAFFKRFGMKKVIENAENMIWSANG
jgi:FkbM family methyltransferase